MGALGIAAAGAAALLALGTFTTSTGTRIAAATAHPRLERGLRELPLAAQATISAALGRDEPSYHVRATGSGFTASNLAQHLRAQFGPGGASIRTGGAQLSLALSAYGAGNALTPAPYASPRLDDNRVLYSRGAIEEWYSNGPLGIEQGFTLAHPLGTSAATTLAIGVGGNLRAHLASGQVVFERRGTRLRYTAVEATDASGRALRAWLGLAGGRILIRVDTAGARYPVRIDPTLEQAELTASGTTYAPIGSAVAISGGTAVVGANGAAYVFTEPAAGWSDATQSATLTAGTADGLVPQGFGDAVAVDGGTIVVGASISALTSVKERVGAAYVFTEPNGGWSGDITSQTATLSAATPSDNAELGDSVAIDGDVIAVGAPEYELSAGNYGAVFEYTMPDGGWASQPSETQTAELTGFGTVGVSVAVGAGTIVAGAGRNPASDTFDGSASVWTEPAGGWGADPTQTSAVDLSATDGANGDELGQSVAISADGTTIAAGAPDHAAGANTDQGAVYVYTEPASGGWAGSTGKQESELTVDGGAAGDQLGTSVAVDGDTVYGGAPLAQDGAGDVYEFEMPAGGWASQPSETQTSTLPSGAGSFGTALAAQGGSILVGAPGANSADGAAFTFTPPAPPTSVAFTVTPYNDPILAGRTLTFAVTNPDPDATYVWTFGNGHTATGTTVQYAYPPPPITDTADQSHFGCPTGESHCTPQTDREAVYTVTVEAVANSTVAASASKSLVVVPAQAPTANFTIVRSTTAGGNGDSTDVTQPVTIVPQGQLSQTESSAQDQIVEEEFWFDSAGAPTTTDPAPSRPPDLICYPNGTCSSVAGVTGLGTGAVRSGRASYSPSSGFESFSINFWNAALAQMGAASNGFASTPAVPLYHQVESVRTPSGIDYPPLTAAYKPLSDVNLATADGYLGEQGIPYATCLPGTPYVDDSNPISATAPNGNLAACYYPGWQKIPFSVEANDEAAEFGPYDLSHYGVNSEQQLEDQWNFLYNYATAVGVTSPLNDAYGPATGATQGKKGTVNPRQITMVAVDEEGQSSAPVTQPVPLTPGQHPDFNLCVGIVSHTPCVKVPNNGAAPFSITTGDVLRFGVTGHSGGADPIKYYAISVGQPVTMKVIDTASAEGNYESECDVPSLYGSWIVPGEKLPAQPQITNPNYPGYTGGSSQPITQPASGPHASADATRRSRARGHALIQSTNPEPPFSDLLAGDAGYHPDCGGYADRIVNADGTPGPAPSAGPNTILHAALRSHSNPSSGGYPSLAAALTPAGSHPAPTVANPVLITTDPNDLEFTFSAPNCRNVLGSGASQTCLKDAAGTYSVSIAAYTAAGLGAVTKIDGFLASPGKVGGRCQKVSSETLTVRHDGHQYARGFSGDCVTRMTSGSNHHTDEYASAGTIDVNGVPLSPPSGDSIVIDNDKDEFYVTKCDVPQSDLNGFHGNPCPQPSHPKDPLYLALGSGSNGIPGIAEIPDFATKIAYSMFAQLPKELTSKGQFKPVGATPTYTPKNKHQFNQLIEGCGLYLGSQQWKTTPGAKYDGFDVATQPCVGFTDKGGAARVGFWDSLPPGFSDGGASKPETSEVVLYGSDQPAVTSLSTYQYANVARAHRPKVQIAGRFPTVKARTADIPGFPKIPNCPPSTNGKSGLSIPKDTDLGPINMPASASFCYLASTGDFIGNVDVDIPAPLPINDVDVGFEIGHGRLIDAGGEVDGYIPVFPSVSINEFKFDIQTDPTEVAAQITAAIAEVLQVEGGVIVKPSTPEVDFEGNVSIAGITFGNFSLDYVDGTVKMSVSISKDFGPASINIGIKGEMAFDPFAFYLEGNGSACLFICLDVQGLVSNQGLAACGSINLVVVNFSGGFAVMWSGPNSGVHLFTGCDLEPYIPAQFRAVDDPDPPPATDYSTARRPHDLRLQPPLGENARTEIDLCPSGTPSSCPTSTVAVAFHSLYNPNDPGATPIVTLTAPDGRTVTTPTTQGYYGFEGSAAPSGGAGDPGQTDEGEALVDQNAVPMDDDNTASGAYCAPPPNDQELVALPASCKKVTTTTMYIADPGTQDWQLSVSPDSPPIEDVELAPQMPKVTSSEFDPRVDEVKSVKATSGGGFKLSIGGKSYSSGLLSHDKLLLSSSVLIPPHKDGSVTGAAADDASTASLPHLKVADFDVPQIDYSRLRAVMVKIPSSFTGQAAVIDEGSNGTNQVVASGLDHANMGSGGVPMLFNPVTDAGSHQRLMLFLSNSEGMPSQEIPLTSFKSPTTSVPRAPKILSLKRTGSTVKVCFDPENAPVASNGIGVALAVNGGQQFQETIPADQLEGKGKRVGIGAARQSSEYCTSIADVDPTEPFKLAVDGSNDGQLGHEVLRSLHAGVSAISEHRLIGDLGG